MQVCGESQYRLVSLGCSLVHKCRLLAATLQCAFLISILVGNAYPTDTAPTTISPSYSAAVVPQLVPTNISDVGRLLSASLGGGGNLDSNAYYVIHRMDYDLDSAALRDVGWYIYYRPWDQTKSLTLAWFDDPLIHSNYKRARIYGSTNIHLIPIMVMPSLDFSKADSATVKQLEIQAAAAIATKSNKLFGTLGDPATLQAVLEAGRKQPLTPEEAKNPVSVLPGLHLLQSSTHLFSTLDVRTGDQLSSVSSADLKASNLSAVELQVLKQLSVWIVRETLDAYAQGNRDVLSSISNIQWKTGSSKDPLAITMIDTAIYVPTELIAPGSNPPTLLQKIYDSLPEYKVTVTAREPQPSSDFKTLLSLIGTQGAAMVTFTVDPSASFQSLFKGDAWAQTASNALHVGALPVDMTIDAIKPNSKTTPQGVGTKGQAANKGDATNNGKAGDSATNGGNDGQSSQSTQTSNALSSIKIQNEKKYHYGIGVGLPLKSFDDVQYDSTNSIITAKKVEKQNVFGFFEFHPYATDTTGTRLRLLPTFMAGLPIAGKALDQQIYAANFGLWKAEPFIGLLVHRDLVPAGNAASNTAQSVSGTAASLTPRWGAHLTYGINVPLSVIKSALSKKSSSGANTSGAKSSKSSPTPSS
jgi:hypothetical protein